MDSDYKDDEKKKEESKNILEKLIKLDKKHSNFDLIDPYINKKLRVRNVQPHSCSMLSQIQQEHGLRYFWRHVNQYYFRKIESSETERLDYFIELMNSPMKDYKRKLHDLRGFTAFDYILDESLKMEYTDQQLSQLNYENLVKHIELSQILYKLSKVGKNQKKIYSLINQKNTLQPRDSTYKKNFYEQLQEEGNQLDKILQNLEEEEELDNKKEDPEQYEQYEQNIEELEKQLLEVSKKNLKKLKEIQEKVTQEKNLNGIIYINNSSSEPYITKPINEKSRKEISAQQNLINQPETQLVQLQYIKDLIIKLDQRQVANSIVMISNTKRDTKGQYLYEIVFEEAINPKHFWISEQELLQLNTIIESSEEEHELLKFYNVSQKTLYSHICHNFAGFIYAFHNRNKLNQLKAQNYNMLDLMKKRYDNNVDLLIKSNFDMCHQCRQLFHESYLIKCNYRSSIMGLPVDNNSMMDPFDISQMELDSFCGRSYYNRKRSNYQQFLKKNGELVCKRKFCRYCLKQYDKNSLQSPYRSDFICPFCVGICFCNRCIRNDSLSRLKGMFQLMGGDIQSLNRELLSEIYLKPNEEDRKQYRFIEETPTKPVNYISQSQQYQKNCQLLKEKLKKYQVMSKIRVEMEKLRLLASQTQRREKLKSLQQNTIYDVFSYKLQQIAKINQQNSQENKVEKPEINSEEIKKIQFIENEQQQKKKLSKKQKKLQQKIRLNRQFSLENQDEYNDNINEYKSGQVIPKPVKISLSKKYYQKIQKKKMKNEEISDVENDDTTSDQQENQEKGKIPNEVIKLLSGQDALQLQETLNINLENKTRKKDSN